LNGGGGRSVLEDATYGEEKDKNKCEKVEEELKSRENLKKNKVYKKAYNGKVLGFFFKR
jgi:hypothetical protein